MKQNIGMAIKTRREQLELTQQQVADYVGVSKSAVSRWESGDVANMGIDKLSKLSEVLSVSPLDIINETELTLRIVPNKNNTAVNLDLKTEKRLRKPEIVQHLKLKHRKERRAPLRM